MSNIVIRNSSFLQLIGSKRILTIALMALWSSLPVHKLMAQDPPPEPTKQVENPGVTKSYEPSTRKYLLGDWGGERRRLEDKGVVFDFFYTTDALASLSGGYKNSNGGFERVRGTMDIDFEKMHVAKGLTFHVTGLWQAGVNLGNQYIGTIANPTSLASTATTRLDSFWLQQGLFSDRLFLRVGQIAGMDLYDLQEYGGSFLNQPMGYTPATTVQNTYLPYDPGGTPGAEIRVVPVKNYYAKVAAFSGNRDLYPDDPSGFHFKFKDSPVFAAETGFLVQPPADAASTKELGRQAAPGGLYPGVYKLGALFNPGKFTNPKDKVASNGNYLIYLQANQAVYRMGKVGRDALRGLDITFQANGSPSDVSQTNFQFDLGARYIGPFAKRPQDSLAFGYIYSHQSSNFDTAPTATAPGLRFGSENLFELNYRTNITPWLLFQPGVEYIQNPGGRLNQQLGDSFIIALRTKVTF
jgi:porin